MRNPQPSDADAYLGFIAYAGRGVVAPRSPVKSHVVRQGRRNIVEVAVDALKGHLAEVEDRLRDLWSVKVPQWSVRAGHVSEDHAMK